MNEKTKISLKKAVIYILVFALGISVGVLAIKSSERYKDTFSLSEKMTFNAYHILTSLDSAFDNELPYERIYEDTKELSSIASLAIGSNGVFFVGYDEDISFEELNILFECSLKAKFIAGDLAVGKEVPSEDVDWLEKFGIAVNTAYASPDIPSYRVFVQSLIEQELYKPEE